MNDNTKSAFAPADGHLILNAEIIRLREINKGMLEALKYVCENLDVPAHIQIVAKAAITKAEGK